MLIVMMMMMMDYTNKIKLRAVVLPSILLFVLCFIKSAIIINK